MADCRLPRKQKVLRAKKQTSLSQCFPTNGNNDGANLTKAQRKAKGRAELLLLTVHLLNNELAGLRKQLGKLTNHRDHLVDLLVAEFSCWQSGTLKH